MNDKRRGVVLRIDNEHGIGTIMDENGQDIHFRLHEMPNEIEINSKVTFDIQLTAQGLSAMNVEVEKEEILVQSI